MTMNNNLKEKGKGKEINRKNHQKRGKTNKKKSIDENIFNDNCDRCNISKLLKGLLTKQIELLLTKQFELLLTQQF